MVDMARMEQWTSEAPIEGKDKDQQWLAKAREMAALLGEELTRRGIPPKEAPESPRQIDGVIAVRIEGPWRFLYAWIPDWSPNRWAGQYVVRIDTFTDKESIANKDT